MRIFKSFVLLYYCMAVRRVHYIEALRNELMPIVLRALAAHEVPLG